MIPGLEGQFAPEAGYLNTASLGVPPQAALDSLRDTLEDWQRGRLQAADFDPDVARARAAWARLSNVPVSQVAIGSAVSEMVGLVAAAHPDGSRVLTAQGEFTSVSFPFLAHADRGIELVELPLADLAAAVRPGDLVAVSAVQSATGEPADLAGIRSATTAAGARLLVDSTQACGWFPVDGSEIDYLVCGGYKWLLSPRGTAYLSVRPELLDGLRPLNAGWYAGEKPWESIYGAPLRLAADARRFDISPAWFSWRGAAIALELLADLDIEQVRRHNVALANRFLNALGQPEGNSAIVTVGAEAAAEKLAAAGVRTAIRAGRVRASFHLYNTTDDVDRAVGALLG